jgi:methyl-accepting chemotaxis protein
MLVAVCEDMQRMNEWLCGADDPNAELPAMWLERLEAQYTMEEQRSSHHNTVSVERTAAVEFF